MSYFDGIKAGDKIWTIQDGWTEVMKIHTDNDYPIETSGYGYAMDGKIDEEDVHQSAFWSDPGIVAPPRPKRYKKIKMEVRPYKIDKCICLLVSPSALFTTNWYGPIQIVEVEVEDEP